MIRTLCFFSLLSMFIFELGTRPVYALSIDTNVDEVGVYSTFTGGKITLFGSIKKGEDVIVLVLGPREDFSLYEKRKILGVWTNKLLGVARSAPQFYYVGTNVDILSLWSDWDSGILDYYGIGKDKFKWTFKSQIEQEIKTKMEKQIFKIMEEKGLYQQKTRGVKIIGGDLFKTDIEFPKNAPTGTYTVRILTFDKDRILRESEVIPLFVRKRGIVYDVAYNAQERPIVYGLASVFISLSFGLLVVMLLRRAG